MSPWLVNFHIIISYTFIIVILNVTWVEWKWLKFNFVFNHHHIQTLLHRSIFSFLSTISCKSLTGWGSLHGSLFRLKGKFFLNYLRISFPNTMFCRSPPPSAHQRSQVSGCTGTGGKQGLWLFTLPLGWVQRAEITQETVLEDSSFTEVKD